MSVLCALGLHRPGPLPRWNDGFYFTRCTRCGSDLVRTAFERWRVPEGYRVVWGPTPPEPRADVALVPRDGGSLPPPAPDPAEAAATDPVTEFAAPLPEPPPGHAEAVDEPEPPVPSEAPFAAEEPGGDDVPLPQEEDEEESGTFSEPADEAVPHPEEAQKEAAAAGGARLPIEAVLADLRGRDPETAPEPAAPLPPAAEAPRRGRINWDFMDEEPVEQPSYPPIPTAVAAAAVPARGSMAAGEAPSPPAAREVGEEAVPRESRIARALRAFDSRSREPHPAIAVGIAFVLAAALGLAMLRPWASESSLKPGESGNGVAAAVDDALIAGPPNPARSSTVSPTPGQPANGSGAAPAYVAATLLSCREAPSRQSRRVRSLSRGEPVEILARDGEWLSLSHNGRQCWAQARFISPAPPYGLSEMGAVAPSTAAA